MKSSMNRISAVIVTYNPEINVLNDNINSIINYVDKVFIINNSKYKLNIEKDKIKIIENKENLGIAKGLNIGINIARKEGFDYSILLDQDSKLLIKNIDNIIREFNEETKIVVPIVYYENWKNSKREDENKYVDLAITSGTIIELKAIFDCFKRINIFNEDYFIDSVDFDFCLEAKMNNIKIRKTNEMNLIQKLGESKCIKFGKMNFYITNHSYIRKYYIYRNRIYMWRKYIGVEKIFVIKDFIHSIEELFLVILFEQNKKLKIKYIMKGVIGAFNGEKGKIVE